MKVEYSIYNIFFNRFNTLRRRSFSGVNIKTLKATVIGIISLLFSIQLSGQHGNYTMYEVSLKGKVSENQIKSITADQNGFYWLVTGNGQIVRWDGRNFYSPDTLPEDKANIRRLGFWFQPGIKGAIYFSDPGQKKVVYVNEKSQLRIRQSSSKQEEIVFSYRGTFTAIQKKELEFAAKNTPDSIYRKFIQLLYGGSGYTRITTAPDEFYLRAEKRVYCLTNNKVVQLVNETKNLRQVFKIGSSFIAFFERDYQIFQKGKLVATGDLVSAGFEKDFIPNNKPANESWAKQYGEVAFIAHNEIIYQLQLIDAKLIAKKYFTIDNPELYNGFYCDVKAERIFFYKSAGGFVFFEKKKVVNIAKSNNPEENIVYTLLKTNNQDVITNNYFHKYFYTCKTCPFRYDLVAPTVQFKEKLFYFSPSAIYIFNKNRELIEKIQIPDTLQGRFTSTVVTDSAIYCQNGALYKLTAGKNAAAITKLQYYYNNKTLNISYLTNGGAHQLFAVSDDIIYLLNLSAGKAYPITQKPLRYRSIFYDNERKYILAGLNGRGPCVINLKDNKVTHLPTDANNFLDYCHYFIKDKKGDYLLPTNSGLFFLSGIGLEQYMNELVPFPGYIAIEKGFGIPPIEYNGGFSSSGIIAGDSLYFSSMDGIVGIKPENIETQLNAKLPAPILDYVTIDGNHTLFKDELLVNSFYKELGFSFSLTYINYPGVKLQYRIIGYRDTSWIDEEDKRVVINYLPPGQYSIQVRAVRLNSSEILTYRIRILQVWYKTNIAIAGFTVAVLGIITLISVYYLQRIRNRALKDTERNRTQIYQIVAHDLKSPINYYQGLASVIAHLWEKKDFERMNRVFKEIDETGVKLDNLLNNLLNWSIAEKYKIKNVKEKIVVNELLLEILPIYESIASARNLSILQSGDKGICLMANRNLLSVIVRNLLDNAIKHSNQFSEIHIHTEILQNKFSLTVSNPVKPERIQFIKRITALVNSGINLESEPSIGLGVIIIKQLSELMNGEFKMELVENIGSSIICQANFTVSNREL